MIYQNELYELKYSFLNGTIENVTCVTPCKTKKNFQTSHFVANRLFCSFIYLVGSCDYFCSNSDRLNSFLLYYTFCRGNKCIRLSLGNVPIARWLTKYLHTCNIIRLKKNMVFKNPPGGVGVGVGR